jgi:hypothetical protein
MQKPGILHIRHAKDLLRYLAGTRTTGITYSNRSGELRRSYKAFSDATWGTENDRKSVQGVVILRYGGAINWISQRQQSTSQSTMEAEIIAANEGAKELAHLEKLTKDLGERTDDPFVPTLYCDNSGAIDWMQDTKFHAKTKHIEIRHFYIRNDMVGKNRMKVRFIPGVEQPADLLTKQLPIDSFRKHARSIGLDL